MSKKNNRHEATAETASVKKLTGLMVIGIILLVAQAVLSIAISFNAFRFIPAKYRIAEVVVLVVLFVAALVLFILWMLNKEKKGAKTKYVIACVISVISVLVCSIGTAALYKVHETLDGMNESTMKSKYGVYVLKGNSAQTITDAKDYVFGFASDVNSNTINKVFEKIGEECEQEVAKRPYASQLELVDALLDDKVKAIVLSEAYVDILSDIWGYSKFSQKTRLIYECTAEEQVKERKKSRLTEESFIVYVGGSDTRDAKLTTSRNDVNILAVVNPKDKQVLLINTPRDCQIDLSVAPGNMDKLCHCGGKGIDCSIDTLANLYETEINYYAQINFTGIIALVDALGGVTVESDRTFTTTTKSSLHGDTTFDFVEGENTIDGQKALAFARERYALKEDDLGRGAHQMALIKALAKKAMSPAVLNDFTGLLDSVKDMTATNFSASEIESLVQMQLDDPAEWDILTYNLTGQYVKAYVASYSKKKVDTMIPDEQQLQQIKGLIYKVMNGDVLTASDVEKK
ncbi:MAG: LCP family protein [Agathobacter sp.]|nr:LCP family protein [Agathobacter sp.]